MRSTGAFDTVIKWTQYCNTRINQSPGANVSPQQGDLRLSGPPSGQGAGSGARTRDRRVPADLRADSQATVLPTPPHNRGRETGSKLRRNLTVVVWVGKEEEEEEEEREEEEEEEDKEEEEEEEDAPGGNSHPSPTNLD
ncbi:hypothetical protein PoB_000309400 [Plakobranchus ocellatus]|uniref:Uncharacterized protein n=1 Tax=Plakobranchus ocellatus TaxID=259542 RepID=A0AAV3Y0W9_9GAST|nr:hypothetical protein PoB_000309400 [Plakobranchus ocellatus]